MKTIAGTEIPDSPLQRTAHQRGLAKGYEAGQVDLAAKARREHPIQSHMAADSMTPEKLSKDRIEVLRVICDLPGCTAKKLDVCILGGKAHRRSGELEALGLITRDKTGSEMRMWITERGKRLLNERKEK